MVIVDTGLVSLIAQKNSQSSVQLNQRHVNRDVGEVATTIITYEEQMRGWLAFVAKSKTVAAEIHAYGKLMRHLQFYREIPVYPFDELAAVEFQRLRGLHLRVGTMDLKIASIALSLNATLLSRNLRDFTLIPGLDLQDWSS